MIGGAARYTLVGFCLPRSRTDVVFGGCVGRELDGFSDTQVDH